MRCCKKLRNVLLRGVLLVCLWAAAAYADGISVSKAEMHLEEDGYHLSASYDISLTPVMQQALTSGIPLYFVSEFSITRPRWYWLGDDIFHGEQTNKLSYNVLTRQYRISRGALFQNFASLEDAMNMLSRQNSPVIQTNLLKTDQGYFAEWIKREGNFVVEVRLRLDNALLPKPLQVNALTDRDWTLDSDWYRWVVSPAEIAVHDDSKTE